MHRHCVLPSALTAITRTVTVAAGRFEPGHLGELTAVVPFELVDAVLAQTRTVQRRLRDLPSRAGVCFLLAMCLFPEVGYRLVWTRLTAGLSGMPVVCPSAKALRDLRRRLGSAPVRALFEVLAGPLAQPTTPGVHFGPYRTVSFDGCSSLRVPDSERNRAWLGRTSHHGYPTLELMTLIETGTRALTGAVFGPTAEGGTGYAGRLLHLLRPDMLVLWDKGFDSNAFLAKVTGTGAQVLGRLCSNRRTPVLTRLADGSYLSVIGTVKVRAIDAQIAVTCADGTSFTGSYRLATTLTDARHYPATALAGLYHQRWEHESAYYALRHTIMNGRNLRSGDQDGTEQEMWSLLTLYQALRTVMVDAAESLPGTDPDRCSFSIALHTARDQVIQAAGIVTADTDRDALPGTIGRRILDGLLPPGGNGSAPARSNRQCPATAPATTTAGPTPAAPSPVLTSTSSSLRNPTPSFPPPPATTGTPPPPTHAVTGSLLCSKRTRPASGAPGTSPPTSATSPWKPCIDSSPDGPRPASSTNSAPASTPPQHGPQHPPHDLRKR
ncbi:IS4 family transposase [Streptomyces vinaceus]